MKKLFFTSILILSIITLNAQKNENLILGEWYTSDKDARILMYYGNNQNDDSNKIYGKIVWLEEPKDEFGDDKLDKENPNVELRRGKILGLKIISKLVWDGNEEEFIWDDGEAYDPESGSIYSFKAFMDPKKPNILNCRGYVGFSLLGRTETWTRKMD